MNNKHWTLAALGLAGIGLGWFALRTPEGVVERYAAEREQAVEERSARPLSEQQGRDALMLANVLAEVDKIEASMLRLNETHLVRDNPNAVYTVEQEEDIAAAYSRYLVLRKALFHIAFRNMDYAEIAEQQEQDASFLLAYASGLTLYRNAVLFVVLFKDQPNARRKLNEADPVRGIPAHMFDEMYTNITSPDNVALVLDGVSDFAQRRSRLEASPLLQAPELVGLLERLDRSEAELAEAYEQLAAGQRDVLWTRVRTGVAEPTYNAQSFV